MARDQIISLLGDSQGRDDDDDGDDDEVEIVSSSAHRRPALPANSPLPLPLPLPRSLSAPAAAAAVDRPPIQPAMAPSAIVGMSVRRTGRQQQRQGLGSSNYWVGPSFSSFF